MKKIKTRISKILFAVLAALGLSVGMVSSAFATTMINASVMEFNMNATGNSGYAVAFKPGAADASATLTVDFGAWGGTVASGAQTISTANCSTYFPGSTPLPTTSSLTASGSGNIDTVSAVNTLSTSNTYCFYLSSNAVTNPSAGVYPVVLTDGTDTVKTAIDVIANDQVVVSATVPPSFTLAISGTTDSFTGNLAPASVVGTTGVTATVNTNAQSGWFLWGSDSNTGLRSTVQSFTIPSKTPGSNASLSAGTKNYLTGLPAAGITQGSGVGTTAATAAYASSGAGNGSGLDATPRQLATSNGTANGAIVTIKEYAAIDGVTPAATDYSDTITLVGAGSF